MVEDYDYGWTACVTPRDFFEEHKRLNDKHFRILELPRWGIGSMENMWCLDDFKVPLDPEEAKKMLIDLGMEHISKRDETLSEKARHERQCEVDDCEICEGD